MSYYDDEMTDRAVRAYFRRLKAEGFDDRQINQPSSSLSHRQGNTVTLANINGVLTRYRPQRTQDWSLLACAGLGEAEPARAPCIRRPGPQSSFLLRPSGSMAPPKEGRPMPTTIPSADVVVQIGGKILGTGRRERDERTPHA